MSIQFRSRIKPAIDYSTVLNSYGVCCGIEGTNAVPKSFVECFNEGGHFIPNKNGQQTSTCPDVDLDLGCCFACSFVTPGDLSLIQTNINDINPYLFSGYRSNISLCECNRRGGKWTSGNCPTTFSTNSSDSNYWQTYAVINGVDVRKPKACCHLAFDDTTGWPSGVTCDNVCNQTECALLGTDVYPSVYTENQTCATLDPGCASNEYVSLMANI